ncbi:hypothetical protein IP90_00653 [Luteimonas cucumeris]|uniref:DUF456 domain-containing protein n=1 Tax=Luteimonas cucumeris TaxID=985012 RepID=A0A562LA54_9GAMM|nr:DUF456 domain-containing protein [Luteimonas cucumeris]TWI04520.1 hypothetical protein IP90_00653 [Luteimonas cucumeris]
MDPKTLYYVIAVVLVVVGIIGTVLPALPGLPLVFAGMLLAAWAGDFEQIGPAMIVLLAVLTLLSMAVDFWATAHGAKRVGASRKALVGAVLGTFAGLFVFPPVGLFVGPFAGALAGELLHQRSVDRRSFGHATKVGFGTWFGIVLGVVLKLGIAFAMIGLFALAWWL